MRAPPGQCPQSRFFEILILEWLEQEFSISSQCIIRAAFTFALLDSARHPRDE
jgi:hypothetical protein